MALYVEQLGHSDRGFGAELARPRPGPVAGHVRDNTTSADEAAQGRLPDSHDYLELGREAGSEECPSASGLGRRASEGRGSACRSQWGTDLGALGVPALVRI